MIGLYLFHALDHVQAYLVVGVSSDQVRFLMIKYTTDASTLKCQVAVDSVTTLWRAKAASPLAWCYLLLNDSCKCVLITEVTM